jgi:hypothetical protein
VVFSALRSANITILVERKSRYVALIYNTNKYTQTAVSGIQKRLQSLPVSARKSYTFDRGSEFASYKQLEMPGLPHSSSGLLFHTNYKGCARNLNLPPLKFKAGNKRQRAGSVSQRAAYRIWLWIIEQQTAEATVHHADNLELPPRCGDAHFCAIANGTSGTITTTAVLDASALGTHARA